jgi:hypothetical protein
MRLLLGMTMVDEKMGGAANPGQLGVAGTAAPS